MRKALMVTEMIAKWSDEGFYLPDDSNTDDMKTYEKCLACGTVLIEKPVSSKKKVKKEQEDFKYRIPDEYWEQVHNLDYLVANAILDPEDTERHINLRVSDATMMPREEVERQHKAWHKRQTEARLKIPEKIPLMFGEQLPNGVYVTRLILIDKSDPRWDEALEEFIRWKKPEAPSEKNKRI